MKNTIALRIYRALTVSIIVFFLAVTALLLAGFYYLVRKPFSRMEGEIALSGLHQPVTVLRDRWGVPHIFAQDLHDLFFASGFVQAQDRMFQMDLLRRVCEGRLSEWVGEDALPSDRLARTVGFFRQARKNLEHASPESRLVLEAFAEGVNAFIARRAANPPLEYKLLRSEIQPWRAEDSLALALYIGWGLTGDWQAELVRFALAQEKGKAAAYELLPRYQGDGPYIIPPEKWPKRKKPDFETEGARLMPDSLGPGKRGNPERDELPGFPATAAACLLKADRSLRMFITGSMAKALASNSFAVDGTLSASGKPILANDPHLELTLPAVWYELHLSAGNYEAAGVTFPGIPVVVLGHSRKAAWAATTTTADMDDLFIERINPQDPEQYLWKGGWEHFRVVEEDILVKKKSGAFKKITLKVRIGRHGPIINDALDPRPELESALALSWTGFEIADPVAAFLDAARAESFDEFSRSIQKLACPVQNWLFAGENGEIGYIAAGLYPVRPRGDGTFPLPGWEGTNEWQGFALFENLPRFENPESHYIVTANNQVLPEGILPYTISWNYAPPYRAARIEELLKEKSRDKLTSSEMAEIQMDTVSLRAKRLLPIFLKALEREKDKDPELERAFRHLSGWNCDMKEDEPAALLFAWTYNRALLLTYQDEIEEAVFPWFLEIQSLTPSFDRLLEQGDSPLFDLKTTRERERRDDIIILAFRQVIEAAKKKMGPRMSRWEWGKVHRLVLRHPLGRAPGFQPLADLLNINLKPVPMPGDRNTVNNGFYPLGKGFDITVGPSMRHIVDFAALDSATMAYPGGQSGQPFSPHYADLLSFWLSGKGHPMLMSRETLEKEKPARLVLKPLPSLSRKSKKEAEPR